MADDSGKRSDEINSMRHPTERELWVLRALSWMSDRIVLVPIIFNGQERFGIALLSESSNGEQYVQVLASLFMPTDEVLDSRGLPGYNRIPNKKDLN